MRYDREDLQLAAYPPRRGADPHRRQHSRGPERDHAPGGQHLRAGPGQLGHRPGALRQPHEDGPGGGDDASRASSLLVARAFLAELGEEGEGIGGVVDLERLGVHAVEPGVDELGDLVLGPDRDVGDRRGTRTGLAEQALPLELLFDPEPDLGGQDIELVGLVGAVARRAWCSRRASSQGWAAANREVGNDTPRGYHSSVTESVPAQPGYHDNKDDVLKRLRRIEGQVRGLQRMVDEDTYCIDVLTQVSAATRALQSVAVGLLDEHLRHCVADAAAAGERVADDRLPRPPRPSSAWSGHEHRRHLRRPPTPGQGRARRHRDDVRRPARPGSRSG